MADRTEPTTEPADCAAADRVAGFSRSFPADYRRLRDGVLALLRAELRDFALADDLCHEAFRIVLERLARQPLEDPARLDSYLMQTARHLVIEHRRRSVRQRTATGQQEAIDRMTHPQDDPAAAQQAAFRTQAVRRLLLEMRLPRDRELLVRVYLYDQDKDQVCRELGIDGEHYKRVLHRARARFAELLQRRYRPSDLLCIALV
ncbi:MAG: sigma-70 family RNA polymerase sigma factor [Steroidobacteraceae bacterium]|nr:sigma-70 family RNA polymerase sigma factor [Steroidobacteraceae bacterium]